LRDALVLGNLAYGNFKYTEAVHFYSGAQEIDPAAALAANIPIRLVRSHYHGIKSGEFTLDELATSAEAILQTENSEPHQVLEIADRLVRAARYVDDPSYASPYLVKALELTADESEPDIIERRSNLVPLYALIVEGDAAKAMETRKQLLPVDWENDPKQLNRMAWWCFENRVNLAKAEEFARKAVQKSQDETKKANCLDTLAEILNARGNAAAALETMEQAIALDPKNDYYQKQLEKFKKAETKES